ncbi:hypothetical protein RINTHH_15880 [Richelia intracellularis HH01]|uniref:Uncharacterized protein n=1 Tax=Richelia intracellularis HH01 TaxID=1165094 RepID=M1X0X3_9NOST|nr:hypothetical protein [Richelia intracellularis]CCH67743.1 hypothetical protein RINTHH_15880 [Richelia intracellularis HH01]
MLKLGKKISGYQSIYYLYLPKPFELEELGAAIQNFLVGLKIIKL